MAVKTVLAVDLGAESGRVMAAHFDGQALNLEELHRFPNTTVTVRETLHWDFLRLWRDVQDGIRKGEPRQPASVGVDTWGLDFGLLDSQGNLVSNPVHYRDKRTDGMMEKAFAKFPREEIFYLTGIQFMPINTLYQMLSLVEDQSPQLQIAETFLTAPDLLNYWMTGKKVCEFTNATTTQMFNPRTGTWATSLLEKLRIPTDIFPEVVPPGTLLGDYEGLPVIAPACHDTGSAVAAVPAQGENFAYISSGTWSLVGLEVREPVINPASLAINVTNEGGVYDTYRLLKNVMGLWILQQCRVSWAAGGYDYSYDELVGMAQSAPSLHALFDPNDPAFLPPGDHPQVILDILLRTGQSVPSRHAGIVRCVLESLALKYGQILAGLQQLTGGQIETVHIVGGGAQNALLNQFTANATGLPVVAGPVEATVIGNALVQLITLGEIADLGEARQIVSEMEGLARYEPQDASHWRDASARFAEFQS